MRSQSLFTIIDFISDIKINSFKILNETVMSHNSLIKCQISSTTHNISLSLTIKMDNCKVINAIEK